MKGGEMMMKTGDKVTWVKPAGQEKRLDWNGIVLKVYPETEEVAVEWRRADGGGKLTVSLRKFSEVKPQA